MTDKLARLRRDYTPAFLAHLTVATEMSLQSAYGLGRTAMAEEISMLDLVHVHHSVFLEVALTVKDVDELPPILDAAAAFLVEALAPFAMAHQHPTKPTPD
ncbi:MAG: phosphatase RsbU N-terminal domain-containing protein [Nocardioidaceae bacterium]